MKKIFDLHSAKKFITTINVQNYNYGKPDYNAGIWGECINQTKEFNTFAEVVKEYAGGEISDFKTFATTCSAPELSALYTEMNCKFPVCVVYDDRDSDEKIRILIMHHICKLYLMETFLQNPNITPDQIEYAKTLIAPDEGYLKSIFEIDSRISEEDKQQLRRRLWSDIVDRSHSADSKQRKENKDKYLRPNIRKFVEDLRLKLGKSILGAQPQYAFDFAIVLRQNPSDQVEWAEKSELNMLILNKSVLLQEQAIKNYKLSKPPVISVLQDEVKKCTLEINKVDSEIEILESKVNTYNVQITESFSKIFEVMTKIAKSQPELQKHHKTLIIDLSTTETLLEQKNISKLQLESQLKSANDNLQKKVERTNEINHEINQLNQQITAIDSEMRVEIKAAEEKIEKEKINPNHEEQEESKDANPQNWQSIAKLQLQLNHQR